MLDRNTEEKEESVVSRTKPDVVKAKPRTSSVLKKKDLNKSVVDASSTKKRDLNKSVTERNKKTARGSVLKTDISRRKSKVSDKLNSSVISTKRKSVVDRGSAKSQTRKKSVVKNTSVTKKKGLNKSVNEGKGLNRSFASTRRKSAVKSTKTKPIKLSKGKDIMDIEKLIKVEDIQAEETKEIPKETVAQKVERLTKPQSEPVSFIIRQLVENRYLPLAESAALSLVSPDRLVLLSKLKTVKIEQLKQQIAPLEEQLSKFTFDSALDAMIKKQFTASKTAQNGLNFINKDEEKKLSESAQTPEITNIFKFVLILLEEYEEIPDEKVIPLVFNDVFSKHNVSNISILVSREPFHWGNYSENKFKYLVRAA